MKYKKTKAKRIMLKIKIELARLKFFIAPETNMPIKPKITASV
jgi:hypothetical protein